MKCGDPVLCYLDSKGKRIFRNWSFAVRTITGVPQDHIVLDCGKCLHCRKKRAYELAARCVLHASMYKENCFLTLTYDEKKKGYHNVFNYSDVQKFKKRLRKAVSPKKIEVFNVHEYGKNGKKHWHLIVFNHDFSDKDMFTVSNGIPLYTSKKLSRLWPYGHCSIGDVSEASAMYQAQYMEKDFKNHNTASPKKSHSKHSGIGRPYFEKHYKQILMLGYIPFNGRKLPVPRYFQKLARKHYAHFYDPSLFADTYSRKALYRPFPAGLENKEIADLYSQFVESRVDIISQLQRDFEVVVQKYLTTKEDPDFIKSLSNNLYDLHNKQKEEKF